MRVQLWDFEDVSVIPLNLPNNSVELLYKVTGWEWWLLLSAMYVLDNNASVTPAEAAVKYDVGRTEFFIVPGPFQMPAGLAGQVFAAVGNGSYGSGTNLTTMALPSLPVIGDGQVRLGFADGDAGTFVGTGFITIAGKKYRSKRS